MAEDPEDAPSTPKPDGDAASGKIDYDFLNQIAEMLPKPDGDAASGKIDYDFLNQIAEMLGMPAVSGAPRNQIARFLGFFVCFVCLLVSKDATQTQSPWLLPRSLRVRRLRFSIHDAGACFSATFGPSCFRCLPEEASRYVQQPYSSASREVVAMKRGNVHSKRALFQRVFGS
jgi:hypothetical protein